MKLLIKLTSRQGDVVMKERDIPNCLHGAPLKDIQWYIDKEYSLAIEYGVKVDIAGEIVTIN